MEHSQKAKELFLKGCNCSQAVFAAFCDVTGIREETAIKMASPFGGGLGRLREVCGAVNGMCLAAGCLFGYTDLNDPQAKSEHYRLIASLVNRFKEENGSYICRELLGLSENTPYSPQAQPRDSRFYEKRPCIECVAAAAEILDDYLNQNQNMNKSSEKISPVQK